MSYPPPAAPPTRPANILRRYTVPTYILSFMGDISIGLFNFALSLFTYALAARLSMTPQEKEFWVGMVATGWGMVYCFSPVILGKISDRIGRRASLVIGMAGFALVNCAIFLFATHPLHLLIGNMATAFLFGFYFPVLGAHASEISVHLGARVHARVLGRFMIAWSLGLTIGPLIGGLFSALVDHLVAFIFLAFLACCIMLISAMFLKKPPDTTKQAGFTARVTAVAEGDVMEVAGKAMTEKNGGHVGGKNETDLAFVKVALMFMPFVFSFVNMILFTIFPQYGLDHVHKGVLFASWDISLVLGFVIFLLGIGRTATFFHASRLARSTREKLMVACPFGMFATTLCIYLFPIGDILLVIFPLYGAFSGYTFSIGLLFLMEITESGKGMKAGLYEAAVGIGTLSATIISSFIGQVNPAYPYFLASLVSLLVGCCVLGMRVLLLVARHRKH